YKRPTGQIVLYNQEDNGVEVKHIVPGRLGILNSQTPVDVNERRVVGGDRSANDTNHSGLLQQLERKASICPTCLRPIGKYSESSWESHVASEISSNSNDMVTTDRDYFKLLGRYLQLQQPQFALETDTGKIEDDQQFYASSGNTYYKSRLQSLPDISDFQIDREGGHVLDNSKEEHIGYTVSGKPLIDEDDESEAKETMLISPGADRSTPETRTIAEEINTSKDGVSERSFNQGYYERFFMEQKKLGKGLRGSVFSCQHILDGVFLGYYAVKKVAVGNNHVWLKRMLREVKLLESLRHPNVVEYKHSWLEMHRLTAFGPRVPCLFILMEYANGGNLQEYMEPKADNVDMGDSGASLKRRILDRRRRRRNREELPLLSSSEEIDGLDKGPRVLSVEEIWSFFSDICNGLAHLHQLQIIHRDLKHMNLLLHWNDPINKETSGETPRIMLTDFGECEILSQLEKRNRTGATGTMEFMAPELIEVDSTGRYLDSYSTKADMWSLGIVLYYLCYSRLPYSDVDDLDVLRRDILDLKHIDFMQTRRPPYAEKIPSELQGIMRQLLNYDESKRPDINDIIHQIVRKRGVWHNRNHDASRFEIRDLDVASNGTSTPDPATIHQESDSQAAQNNRDYYLWSGDTGESSSFPIMRMSGSEAFRSGSFHDKMHNVSLSNMIRRHSVGLATSSRRDSAIGAKDNALSSNSGSAASIEDPIGFDSDGSEDSFESLDVNVNTGSKRHLEASSVPAAASASRHKRPRYLEAPAIGDNQRSSAFIVKTAIMLAKVYFLQTLSMRCNEQSASLRYLMGVSLVFSAFDMHQRTLRFTLVLLAANACLLLLWRAYYFYHC
ncbi:putative serine/threonine-protein kinase iks1, partial [Coemansia sp. BCRC 34490]